jgi:hypothetical protein
MNDKSWSEKGDRAHKMLVRLEAEYVADPDRRSIEYWHQYVRAVIPIDDLRKIVLSERWDQRRRAYWRGVQAAWLRGQQQRILVTRDKELQDALELRDMYYSYIKPQQTEQGIRLPLEPSSYDGALRAYVALDGMIEGKRDKMIGALVPLLDAAEAGKAESLLLPEKSGALLDGNETRALAHHLLKITREKRRREMGIIDVPVKEDEDNDEGKASKADSDAGSGGDRAGVEGED